MDCPVCDRAQPQGRARWCGACGATLRRPGPTQSSRGRRGGQPGRLDRPRLAGVAGLLAIVSAGIGVWALLGGADDAAPRPPSEDVGLPESVGPPEIPGPEAASGAPSPRQHELSWEVDVAAPASQVAIADAAGVVAASVDTTLTGLDAATGEVVWEHELPSGPVRALEVADTTVVAALGPGGVQAVDAETGALAWEQDRPADDAVLATGMVVVSGDDQVRGIALDTGEIRWTRHEAGTVASGRAEDVVVIARQGAVVGVVADSGATRWVLSAYGEPGRPDQSVTTAVLADEGRLRVIGLDDGADIATVEIDLLLDERVRGRPRIAGEQGVVVSVGDGLVGFDADLEPRWRTRWETQVALLSHSDPTLAVLGGVGVRGVEPATGADVFRVTPSAWFTAAHLQGQRLALGVHTPTRGRILLTELALD